MNRKEFQLANTMGSAATGGLAGVNASARDHREQEVGRRIAFGREGPRRTSEFYGEPYELAGTRLVFSNSYYIRPGSFGWFSQSDEELGLYATASPMAAHMLHADCPYGVRLMALKAERLGPRLEFEQSRDEHGGVFFATVVKDGGIFRAWGSPWPGSVRPAGHSFAYYESTDGLSWKRPKLGLTGGDNNNNIVNIVNAAPGTMSVFIDPSARADERYKVIATGSFSKERCDAYMRRRPFDWDPMRNIGANGAAPGVIGGVSPDGLHWTMLPDPLVMEMTDTQLTAYFDPHLQKYVAYTRTWPAGRRSARVAIDPALETWPVARRSIGRSETADFANFPLHETILEPGPDLALSDTLYGNGKTTIPGAPDHHLLFPTIWHIASDSTSIGLASSHDGRVWFFLPGSPIFTTGPFGAFDGGCIFAHPNLMELPDGSWVLPYTGFNVPHKYPRGLNKFAPGYAVWPKGRLVAVEAVEHGAFATVAIVPPSRILRINALTVRGGSITVEVAGMDGKPVPGRSFAEAKPIVGDNHWIPLVWKGKEDLGYQEGTAIILRFRMNQAQLFGLEFA